MYNESKMLFFQENTTKKQEYQKSKKLLFTIKSKKITKIHIYIYIYITSYKNKNDNIQ